jgi:hypothetical protein
MSCTVLRVKQSVTHFPPFRVHSLFSSLVWSVALTHRHEQTMQATLARVLSHVHDFVGNVHEQFSIN